MFRGLRATRLAAALLVFAVSGPAHGGSTLATLGQALRRGVRTCEDTLKNTAFCVDLFAGTDLPVTDIHAGAAIKLSLPAYNTWKRARAEGRRPRLVYFSAGVSNSLAFAGYNPLFGGWNANYSVPIHGGFGGGLFAGGPYTGFFVNTPFLVSLGGWVRAAGRAPPNKPPPDPFAAVTLAVPGLSHLGLAVGLRLWIYSPALAPLVRPFRRPAWWLHDRRQRVQRWVKQRGRAVFGRLRRALSAKR